MQVVLLKDVPQLGRADDAKNVADGYAKNFLFPRKLAVAATPQLLKEAGRRKRAMDASRELNLKETQKLVKEIDGHELEISVNASEEGTLYAAVGEEEIRQAFREQGISAGNFSLVVKEHLKELGEHAVILRFPHNLEAEVKVSIVRKPDKPAI